MVELVHFPLLGTLVDSPALKALLIFNALETAWATFYIWSLCMALSIPWWVLPWTLPHCHLLQEVFPECPSTVGHGALSQCFIESLCVLLHHPTYPIVLHVILFASQSLFWEFLRTGTVFYWHSMTVCWMTDWMNEHGIIWSYMTNKHVFNKCCWKIANISLSSSCLQLPQSPWDPHRWLLYVRAVSSESEGALRRRCSHDSKTCPLSTSEALPHSLPPGSSLQVWHPTGW